MKIYLLCEQGVESEPYGAWHVLGWNTDQAFLENEARRLEIAAYVAAKDEMGPETSRVLDKRRLF